MRKESTVVIETPGRDLGKVFRLRELSASQSEAWGTRLMLALAKSGAQVPENFFSLGMAGVAAMGIQAIGGVSWDIAKPLMDEIMACIKIQPNPTQPAIVRELIEDDIEEVATRVMLREAVIELHTGFSIAEFISNLRAAAQHSRAVMEAERLGEDTEILDRA
jgi:hypothetical protein